MTPRPSILLGAVLFVIVAAVLVSPCGAQVLQPPPRPVRGLFGGGRPPDPNRSRQELTFTLNLLGGYDDNLTPPAGGQPFAPNPTGYVGFGESIGRYFFGRDVRSVEVTGRGYMNTYRNVGLTPAYGGDLTTRVATSVGRRARLQGSAALRYDPFFSLGVFGPLQAATDIASPDSNPTNALAETRSWATDAGLSFEYGWSRRTRTTVGYTYNQQDYVEGAAFDTRMHAGSLAIDRSFGRSTSVRANYRYSNAEYDQANGAIRPLVNQAIDVGLAYQRSLSRTRRVNLSGGAGTIYVDTTTGATGAPLDYWTPSGYASARLDLGQSWSIAGDYRRSVSVLEGISPETFLADAANVTVGGFIGSRLESVFTAGYANGTAGGSTASGELGEYDSYTLTAQLRASVTRWWSAVISFTRNNYDLNTAATRVLGVPGHMRRNAIRIGFTWSVPLYGSYTDRGAGQPRGRN